MEIWNMRDPNTYRAAWRNTARGAGALHLCRAYLSANWAAKLVERQKECEKADRTFLSVLVDREIIRYPDGYVYTKRVLDEAKAALIEFWTVGRQSRVTRRILKGLTAPAVSWHDK
jgi:hypothetical protein